MQSIIICIILIFIVFFPTHVSASDCSSIPTTQKILLKTSDIRDSIMLFLIMDPKKQIPYRLARANTLYEQSNKQTEERLAYVYALRGEDHMTRLVGIMRGVSKSELFNIEAINTSIQKHLSIIKKRDTTCNWQTIEQFIASNRKTIDEVYYLRLPTDSTMQLLKKSL